MPTNYGLATYPGVEQFESISVTWGLGITPSSISFVIKPQDLEQISKTGDLVLTYNDVTINFKDCLADAADFTSSASGQFVTLKLKDYRWTWAHGEISGWYNYRNKDGSIRIIGNAAESDDDVIGNPKKSIRKLAKLCLEKMGVTDYNADNLPDDIYPEVRWQVENPAQALANLVESVGFVIAPQPNKHVDIVKLNEGAAPFQDALADYSETIDPVELPQKIVVVCGPTRWVFDFELEPVGLETNGVYKKTLELSYIAGVTTLIEIANRMCEGLGTTDNATIARLGEQCLYKMYRIKKPDRAKIDSLYTDFPAYDYIEQFLPLEKTRVKKESVMGEDREKPALVYGVHTGWGLGGEENTLASLGQITLNRLVETDFKNCIVSTGFDIDQEFGVVIFNDKVSRESNDEIAFAQLRLRVAFSLRDKKTGEYIRYRVERTGDPNSPVKERILQHDEIVLAYKGDDEMSTSPNQSNKSDVDAEANYYIDKLLDSEYRQPTSQSIDLVGLKQITIDGLYQSVTYSISASGTSTNVQYGADFGSRTTIPYKLRRQFEKTASASREAKKTTEKVSFGDKR